MKKEQLYIFILFSIITVLLVIGNLPILYAFSILSGAVALCNFVDAIKLHNKYKLENSLYEGTGHD